MNTMQLKLKSRIMKPETVKDVPINKTFAMQINKISRSPK
jgi:hypothetical protein